MRITILRCLLNFFLFFPPFTYKLKNLDDVSYDFSQTNAMFIQTLGFHLSKSLMPHTAPKIVRNIKFLSEALGE